MRFTIKREHDLIVFADTLKKRKSTKPPVMTNLSKRFNLQTGPIEISSDSPAWSPGASYEVLVCKDAHLAVSVASNLILSASQDTRLIMVSKSNHQPSMHYRAMIQSGIIPKPPMAQPLPRVVALTYDCPDAPPGTEGKPDALLATLESSFTEGYDWALIDLSGIDQELLPQTMHSCRACVPQTVAILFLCTDLPIGPGPCLTIADGVLTAGDDRFLIRAETVVLSPFRENGRPVSVDVHHVLPMESDGQIRFTPLPWL